MHVVLEPSLLLMLVLVCYQPCPSCLTAAQAEVCHCCHSWATPALVPGIHDVGAGCCEKDINEVSGKYESVCLPLQLKLEMISFISYKEKGKGRVVSRSLGEMYFGASPFEAFQSGGMPCGRLQRRPARGTSRPFWVPGVPPAPPKHGLSTRCSRGPQPAVGVRHERAKC